MVAFGLLSTYRFTLGARYYVLTPPGFPSPVFGASSGFIMIVTSMHPRGPVNLPVLPIVVFGTLRTVSVGPHPALETHIKKTRLVCSFDAPVLRVRACWTLHAVWAWLDRWEQCYV